jgi:hypothetical protein
VWLSDAAGGNDVADVFLPAYAVSIAAPPGRGEDGPAEVTVAWWVAEKGAPTELLGPTEISQEAAKRSALARSKAKPGTVFQVRYHVNANGATEVRWEVVDGNVTEVTGDAQKRP